MISSGGAAISSSTAEGSTALSSACSAGSGSSGAAEGSGASAGAAVSAAGTPLSGAGAELAAWPPHPASIPVAKAKINSQIVSFFTGIPPIPWYSSIIGGIAVSFFQNQAPVFSFFRPDIRSLIRQFGSLLQFTPVFHRRQAAVFLELGGKIGEVGKTHLQRNGGHILVRPSWPAPASDAYFPDRECASVERPS